MALTCLAEEIFVRLVNKERNALLNATELKGVDLESFKTADRVAFREARLLPYGPRYFDGASRVDVVVRIAPGIATAFELKLGTTRLGKSRIDGWLKECETSHGGKRWSGNMMAILDRRFPETAPEAPLKVAPQGADEELTLTKAWFVVAQRSTIEGWEARPKEGKMRPKFSKNVTFLAFEKVVDAFGGKEPFNALVLEMLKKIDFYDSWINEPEDAGTLPGEFT